MALKDKQIVPTSRKILKRSLQTFLHACVVYVLFCIGIERPISSPVCGLKLRCNSLWVL